MIVFSIYLCLVLISRSYDLRLLRYKHQTQKNGFYLPDIKLETSPSISASGSVDIALSDLAEFFGPANPDNPFIDIRKGEILLETGHPELAENILFNLLQLPWSELYYPGIRNNLRQKFAADAM